MSSCIVRLNLGRSLSVPALVPGPVPGPSLLPAWFLLPICGLRDRCRGQVPAALNRHSTCGILLPREWGLGCLPGCWLPPWLLCLFPWSLAYRWTLSQRRTQPGHCTTKDLLRWLPLVRVPVPIPVLLCRRAVIPGPGAILAHTGLVLLVCFFFLFFFMNWNT